MSNQPKVGTGVIVMHNNRVLLGKRKNAHGAGTWCFPGGHLEYGESWEECAKREVLEEAGIIISSVQLAHITNDVLSNEEKHFVTIFMQAELKSGEVRVCEPDKCEAWDWFEWSNLPTPLFKPVSNLLSTDYNPFNK